MEKFIHIALGDGGRVLAHFIDGRCAAEWCADHAACHLPFNLLNRYGEPPPAVGAIYRA